MISRHFIGPAVQLGENGMRAQRSKPVRGIRSVRLLTVQDGMPEAAFRRCEFLDNFVAFLGAGKIQPQAGQRGFGSSGARK